MRAPRICALQRGAFLYALGDKTLLKAETKLLSPVRVALKTKTFAVGKINALPRAFQKEIIFMVDREGIEIDKF